MTHCIDIQYEAKQLRLLGAALALQHATCTAANLIPIPNTGRFIAIGTPAEVARLLEIAPAAPASINVLDTLDAVTGDDIANIAAFKTERFYLADDVVGLLRRTARQAALTEMIELGQEVGADRPLAAAAGAGLARKSPETRMDAGFGPGAGGPAAGAVQQPVAEFEELLDRYWDIAHSEGETGQSRGSEAQEVLSKLRAQLASERQAKEYEQRHAVESEKAVAQLQAQLAAARQVGKHLFDAVAEGAAPAPGSAAQRVEQVGEHDHSEGGHVD